MGNFNLNKDKLREVEEASEGSIDYLSDEVERCTLFFRAQNIVKGLADVLKGKNGLGRADIAIVKNLIEEQEKELDEYRKNARKKGVWLHFAETDKNKECWQCSNCKKEITENPKFMNRKTGEDFSFVFCPICGAPMADEVKEGRKSADEVIGIIRKEISKCNHAVNFVMVGCELYTLMLRELNDEEIEARVGTLLVPFSGGNTIYIPGSPIFIDTDAEVK